MNELVPLIEERYPNYRYLPIITRGVERKRYVQDLLSDGELEERLGAVLPAQHIRVHLEMTNDQRRHMIITAAGSDAVAMLKNAVNSQ